MQHQSVARDAFERRAALFGAPPVRIIAFDGHDLEACQPDFGKPKPRDETNRPRGDALPLPGLPDRIADVAEAVLPVDLIDRDTAVEFPVFRGEDAQIIGGTGTYISRALAEPRPRRIEVEPLVAPGHPPAHGMHGFVRRIDESWTVVFPERTDAKA